MNTRLDQIKKLRLFLLKEVDQLDEGQLNKIPAGFNNNIIWNMAHMVAALQVICYRRADVPLTIGDNYISPFLTNTKPGSYINRGEIEIIKGLLISTVDTLQIDYAKNIFTHYTPSPNVLKMYNISLDSIEDAIVFLHFHDGFHIGQILSLKHLV